MHSANGRRTLGARPVVRPHEAIRSSALLVRIFRPRRLRRWKEPASTREAGWFVPSRRSHGFPATSGYNAVVLQDGTIWRGSDSGLIEGRSPIDTRDEMLAAAVGDVLRAVASMRSPMYVLPRYEVVLSPDGYIGRADGMLG